MHAKLTAKNDLSGMRFGRLVVQNVTGKTKDRKPIWLCQCDCGNSKEVVYYSLLRGDTKSCGCLAIDAASRPKRKDLVGQKFNRLTVIAPAGKIGNNAAWLCSCECGNQTTVRTGALKFGHTKSCGCLNKERVKEVHAKDLAGVRSGRLVAIEDVGANKHGARLWRCKCDCGNETVVTGYVLTAKRTISCGCASIDQPGIRPADVRAAHAVYGSRRRARKADADGSFSRADIERLLDLQRGCCACCGKKLGKKFHRDHKVPLALGGSNDASNIELLCQPCNLSKGAKDPIAWANENGRLL